MQHLRRPSFCILHSAFCIALAFAVANANALDHLYSVPMSVGGYSGESVLAGFPVLVRLAQGAPSGFSYSDCMAGGADIHFVDADGADIPCEVETWDTTGTSLIWVRLPVLTNNAAFEMRYGGGLAASLPSTDTWADYDAVWHFADGEAADSTAHRYHGTLSADTITAAPGKVGGALHLPAGTRIVTAATPNAPLAAGFSVEGWLYMERTSQESPLARTGLAALKITPPCFTLTTPAVLDHNVGDVGAVANEWIHLGVTFQPSTTKGLKVYVNGAPAGSVDSSRLNNTGSSTAYRFGENDWQGQNYLGLLDEMRVAPGIKSADWMAAAYATANSVTFVTYGAKRTDAAGFIVVDGSPSQFGAPSPDYGLVEAEADETFTFTCPASGYNEPRSVSATCTGWNLYLADAASPFRTSADPGESALSCTVVYSEPVRLEWLWGDLVEHGWRYNPTANTITQLGVAAGETPWILNCSASGSTLNITSVNQGGSAGTVNLDAPVTTSDGTPYSITAIGNDAFKDSADLTSLILPDTVLSIGQNAFLRCAYLTYVRLSSTLQTIGKCAFMSCTRLRTVTPFVPESVTSIGEQAFRYCNALSSPFVFGYGSVTYPSSPLGTYVFQQCYALPSASIGPGVTRIPVYTFGSCTSLKTVTLHDGITAIDAYGFISCSSLESFTPFLPAALTSLDEEAFYNCTSLPGEVVIGTNGVFSLPGAHHFRNTKITRLVYGPGAPAAVPTRFCSGCSQLADITLADTVTSIGDYAFDSCAALTSLEMPTNVSTIGTCAFLSCTALARVTPFLPATCTSVGAQAFHNCASLAQPLYFATNNLSASLGDYAFKLSGITAATLGDGIGAIPAQCFYQNRALKTFKMPANVKTIGGSAFSSCSALESVNPFLPESVTSIGGEAFLACTALTNDLVLRPPSAIALGDHTFNQCRSIANMTLGTNVVSLPQGFTRWEDKLRNVFFEGDKPAWHANAFMDMGQHQVRFVVPADNASWTAYAEDPAKATPWTSLSATDQQKYIDVFPGEPYPRARTVSSPAKQWLVSYGTAPAGECDLVVAGDPGFYGAAAVSPAYGTYTNLAATLGLPLTLTAPQYVAEPATIYGCAGYRIETPTAMGFGNGVDYALADPTAPSVIYNPQEDGQRRFSWLWEEAGYAVTVAAPAASAGSVSVSGANLQGYFAKGSTATVTATPASGAAFVRWYGDVPAGHETDATLTVTVNGPVSLSPEFASPWVLSGSGSNMNVTDGYWTIKVSGSRENGIKVGKPTVNSPLGVLDLRKPILGGGFFVSIDGSAFKSSTALTELRLPDTLTAIGSESFSLCTSLTNVVPFLPVSVTNIAWRAFYCDTNLGGDLFFATNGVPTASIGGASFYSTGIRSATLGDGVTSIPGSTFAESRSLGRVVTGDGVTYYGDQAFYNCTSLTNVTPFLASAVTYVGSELFKCVDSSGFALAPITGDLEIGLGGQDVTVAGYHNFAKSSILSARFGRGVKSIPSSALRYSPYLGRVAMTDNVTVIGDATFNDCASLTNVTPFMPASLTSLGYDAFRDCPKLTGSLRLGTDKRTALVLASNNGYQFYNTAVTDATVGPGVTTLTTCLFENSTLKSVTLQSVSTIGLQTFNLTPNLAELRFAGPAPTTVNANAYKWAADKARLYLPKGEATWETWIADNVILWDDLDKATQYLYWDKWPDSRRPFGRTKSTAIPANQWVFRWAPGAKQTVILLR